MNPTTTPESTPPNLARRLFRAGLAGFTAGWSEGFVQANLIAVPAEAARDLAEFIDANPQPCPLLDRTSPGATTTALAPGADLRTDLPAYLVWENGQCVAQATDVTGHWRDDLVTFLLGCSFTFEAALKNAGIPIRHIEQGVNVPMYRTNRLCVPTGRLHGPLVVSMRPIPEALVPLAEAVTARYPAMHGAPVHIGSPADLGIADLDRPDYGDRVQAQPGDVPVFWACGVTPQAAVMASRPPFAISHSPGHMLITDLRHEAFRS